MKHWVTIILLCVVFTACEDNLEFNSPAFQANKDGVLWKSSSREASNSSGGLTITGTVKNEWITLNIPEASTGVYVLGVNKTSNASYTDENGTVFSTLYNPIDNPETPEDESLVFYAEGEIVIDEINTNEGYVSGSFWFTAYDTLGENKVNFNHGVFYRVSFNGSE